MSNSIYVLSIKSQQDALNMRWERDMDNSIFFNGYETHDRKWWISFAQLYKYAQQQKSAML